MSRRSKLRKASLAVNQRKLDLFYSPSSVNKEPLEAEQACFQESMNENDIEKDNSLHIASHEPDSQNNLMDQDLQVQSDVVIHKAVESSSLMQMVPETANLDTIALPGCVPEYLPDLECVIKNSSDFGSEHAIDFDDNAANEIAQLVNDSDDSADWIVEDVKYAICCGNLWYPWLVLRNNDGLSSWIPVIDRIDGIWSLERYCAKCRKMLEKSTKREKSRIYREDKPGLCEKCSSETKNPRKSEEKEEVRKEEDSQQEDSQRKKSQQEEIHSNCQFHGLNNSTCQNCRKCVTCPKNEVCLSDYVILICVESPHLMIRHQETNPKPEKATTGVSDDGADDGKDDGADAGIDDGEDAQKISLHCMMVRMDDILPKIMELHSPHAFIAFPEGQICTRPVMMAHLTAFLYQLGVDYNASQTNKTKLAEGVQIGDKKMHESIEFSERINIQQVIDEGDAIRIEYLPPDYVREFYVEIHEEKPGDGCYGGRMDKKCYGDRIDEKCHEEKCHEEYHCQSENGCLRLRVYDTLSSDQDKFQLPGSLYSKIPPGIVVEMFEQLVQLLIDQFEQLTSIEWSIFQYTPDYGSNDLGNNQQMSKQQIYDEFEALENNIGREGVLFRKIDFKDVNSLDSAVTTKDGQRKLNAVSIKGEILVISGYQIYLNEPMIQFDYENCTNSRGDPIDAKEQPISSREELAHNNHLNNTIPSLINPVQRVTGGRILDLRELIGRRCLQNQ